MRVLTEGFEFGDRGWVKVTGGEKFLLGGGFSVLPSHPRGGQYAMGFQVPAGQSKAGLAYGTIPLPERLTEAYIRYPIWLSSRNFDMHRRAAILIFQSGSYNQCALCINRDSGRLELCVIGHTWRDWDGFNSTVANVVATSNQSIPVGTEPIEGGWAWALLEIHIVLATSGVFEVRMGGIPVMSYTGNLKYTPSQPDGFDAVQIVSPGMNPGEAFFVDDFGINSVVGQTDTSWLGGGSVMALWPNAPGDVSDWVGSDGDAIDNWALVRAGVDGYVQTNTPGATDLYRFDESNISNLAAITGVWVEARGKDLAGDADPIKLVARDGAGNETVSSDIPLPATISPIVGPRMVEPPAGGSWKLSDLADLQAGPRNGS